MAMLAEKKRREKWSVNPRGKAWSEDQNKFGQRLMEKMGWKAGQGLGANSQGPTDIVKARVKNDSKGLGFKENGEEWLKTTSDFDNLLDELASSQEESGEGSQTETPASLEDRSRKSRARLHYHKFTRGKDLSRYSEKDLASIIGPEVIKGKNGQESQSDYTINQVNKGSLEEYFSKKSKSKNRNSTEDPVSGEMAVFTKEIEMDSESKSIDSESVTAVHPTKKKKEKKHTGNIEAKTLGKKKRKFKEIEEEIQSENGICTNNNFLVTEVNSEILTEKRKKKSKAEKKEVNEYDARNTEPTATVEDAEDHEKRKKKKKSKSEIIEQQEDLLQEEEQITKKVVSLNRPGKFLEVLGRKTRLRNIKIPRKTGTDDTYQTEEFMSIAKSDISEETAQSKPSLVKNVENVSVKQSVNGCKKPNSKVAKSKDLNKNSEFTECFTEPKANERDVPKHVVAYEYRLVSAKLKELDIKPPDLKVVIKDSTTYNESTRRKLKQMTKIRFLKTLLPSNDVDEIDASVSKFSDDLKPKIEIMAVLSKLEDKISEIAKKWDDTADSKDNDKEAINVKTLLSEHFEELKNTSQKLGTLIEEAAKVKEDSSISEDAVKESSNVEDAECNVEPRYIWLKKVKDKAGILRKYLQMMAEGKRPPSIAIKKDSTEKKKKKQNPVSHVDRKQYQNTSYSRGRIAHNVGNQRGSVRGVGRGQSRGRSVVPSGGQRGHKSPGAETVPGGVRGSSRGSVARGRGGFVGRGRGLSVAGRGSSSGRGFTGRGGSFAGRGRGRGDTRGRGRISQNNFDAKVYAEKCKKQNKVPEVCFNGVNLKILSGYPAKVTSSLSNVDSKSLSNQANKRGFSVVDAKVDGVKVEPTKKVVNSFSEIVIKSES